MPEINYIKEIPEGTFRMNWKLIAKYKLTEPRPMAKYKDGTHHKGPFCGGINIDLNLITCEDKIVIP